MKKSLAALGLGAAVLGISLCSCSGHSGAAQSFSDSLSIVMGEFNGAQLNTQYGNLNPEMQQKLDKKELLRGIKAVLMADTTQQAYLQGLQIAMQLWYSTYQYETAGIKVDRKALYENYAKAFMADSTPDLTYLGAQFHMLNNRANREVQRIQEEKAEAEKQAKMDAPEAKKNIEDGMAYIAAQKAADAEIQTTDSGLSYKVLAAGSGDPAKASNRVRVKYAGRHIDGTVFDQNDDATFPVRGVIPGFAEGLKMMAPGAHYVLYIPGDIAYSVDGSPDGSIGPMETLVFDVEVLEVL